MSYGDLRRAALAMALAAGCGGDDGGGDTSVNTTLPPATGDMTGDGTAEDTASAPVCNETPTTSFATDIQPIIEATCVEGCHATGGQWPTFLLEGDAASNYAKIVGEEGPTQPMVGSGINLVEPCDPDNSYMYAKLLGTGGELGAPEGLLRMPLTGSGTDADPWVEVPLPADQLALWETWILDGAPE